MRDYLRSLCLRNKDPNGKTPWTQFHFDIIDGNADEVRKRLKACKSEGGRNELLGAKTINGESAQSLAVEKEIIRIIRSWDSDSSLTDLMRAVLRDDGEEVKKRLKEAEESREEGTLNYPGLQWKGDEGFIESGYKGRENWGVNEST